jgi:PAS domain S-box-containing protein
MENFFSSQLDYIYFIYGLAFIIMAIISFYTHYETKLNLPLVLLGCFGLVHGLGQWCNLAAILFGHLLIFQYVRAIVIVCSLVLLFETGRDGLIRFKIKAPSRWTYVIFGLLIFSGAFSGGLAGFQTIANYSLGITGALMTAYVFAQAYRRDESKNVYYLLFSGVLIVSTVIILIGVPKANIFPATIINYQSVFKLIGVPVPFICAMAGLVFTILMASFAYNLLDNGKTFHRKTKYLIVYLPACIMLAIVTGGWFMTNYSSSSSEKSKRDNFVHLALAATSLVNESQISSLSGTIADVNNGNYIQLKNQFIKLRNKINNDDYDMSCRFIYLFALKDNEVIFLVDSELESSDDCSLPGDIYKDASKEVFDSFTNGRAFVEGPTKDQWGTWVSGLAPIRNGQGKVIAVLGIDADAKEWYRDTALIRLFIITTILMISLIITLSIIILHVITSAAAKRLRTIEELEKSEQKYRTLVESLNVGIYSNTTENGICFKEGNTAMAKLLGLDSVEEFKKSSAIEFYQNPCDRFNYLKLLKEKGSVNNYALAFKKKDGTPIMVSLTSQAYFDEKGEIKSIFGVMEDITDRKKAEESIRKTRETLKKILDSMPFGIIIVDKNKRIRLVNHKAIEMTGCSGFSDILGKTCHKFICPSEKGKCPVLDLHQQVDMAERILLTKEGNKVPILKTVTPIMFDNEEVLMESFVDVTKQKEAEEKMMELNKNLEDANAELKNFAYIASHDLREPLRKITSFGLILEKSIKTKIDNEDNENLHYIIDGAKRMSQMIDGLLSYSRVSTKGREFENVEMTRVVAELQQYELGMLIEESHAVINIPQPLPIVKADILQMRQLMQNLIANGIKYQPKGNIPEITIMCKPAANNMVRIEVSDNGIGIAPEYHSSIFAMFKRLHRQNEYEGNGIGLAVCKKIVQRHNGQIGVESQSGKGSTFWFTVPAMNIALEAAQSAVVLEKG